MKSIIFLILFSFSAFSQNYTVPGPVPVTNKQDTTINGIAYKIEVGPRGGCYIVRVSKKTGKEYKQYVPCKK